MDWTITPMSPSDFDDVVAFWRGQEWVGLNESDERGPIEKYLQRNPGMSFVARDSKGVVIGAVLCGHDGRRGYLHHLAVDAKYRRMGLGTILVGRCLAQLSAAGIAKCNIFLLKENAGGRSFWERQGYRSVSWVPMQRVI